MTLQRMASLGMALALIPCAALAQSFNLDFGAPGSPTPGAAYGAAPGLVGAASGQGRWQVIDSSATDDLLDVWGNPTEVDLLIGDAPMFYAGASGSDIEALLLDGMRFLAFDMDVTLSGLQPGAYRVSTYHVGQLVFGMDVTVPGGVSGTQTIQGSFTGALDHGGNYVQHTIASTGSITLTLHVELLLEFNGLSALQVERLDPYPTPFCGADFTNTPCPCGNAGSLDRGCANSVGAGGRLVPNGAASVLADDLRFSAPGLPAGVSALLFTGDAPTSPGGFGAAFGDGLRCVGGMVQRLATTSADPLGQAFWPPGMGTLHGWMVGDTRYFQVWYRDPAGPCVSGFNFTNAVAVQFRP